MCAGVEVAEQLGETNTGAGASALDGTLGNAQQPGGVGNRVALHVDRHNGGPLLDRELSQCPLHHNRRLDLSAEISYRLDILERHGPLGFGAPQPVQAGVDHDAVQPAADRGVMPKRTRATVGREHRVLQRVLRVLAGATGQPGEAMQLPPVTPEQLAEGVAVAGDMGGQQLGVTAFSLDLSPHTHGRTVTNR